MKLDDTLILCKKCLDRCTKIDDTKVRSRFVIGEIINGKCNRCAHSEPLRRQVK